MKTKDKFILFICFYIFIMTWNFINEQWETFTILLFIIWIMLKILVISFSLYSIFSLLIYGAFSIVEDSTTINPKKIMTYSVAIQFMLIGSITGFIFAKYSDNNNLNIFFYLLSLLSFISLFINNSRTSKITLLLLIISILVIYYNKTIAKLKNFISKGLSFIILSTIALTLLDATWKFDHYKKLINYILNVIIYEKMRGKSLDNITK